MIKRLDLKTKIQLFILPLLLIYLLLYFYNNIFIVNQKSKNQINKKELKKEEFKENNVEFFSKIEKFASNRKIAILNLNKKKKLLKITAKSLLSQIETFIDYLENLNNFTKINKLKLYKIKNKKDFIVEIEISLKQYYEKDIKEFLTIKNKKMDLKLNAIIGKYVVINKKILKKGEKLKGYFIFDILKNKVFLKKDEDILTLELFDGKITKKIY